MKKSEIQEARESLGKEFDSIPDERIEFIMYSFRILARYLIEKIENGEIN